MAILLQQQQEINTDGMYFIIVKEKKKVFFVFNVVSELASFPHGAVCLPGALCPPGQTGTAQAQDAATVRSLSSIFLKLKAREFMTLHRRVLLSLNSTWFLI